MRRADAALELLLTGDEERAEEVARELELLNRDRQEAETRIVFAAEAACAPQASRAAMVVAGEGWHPGVVGIVASRLVERWRRPCVAIALEDGAGRGSGRSIAAYDLHAGLAACAPHLTRFGGHRMAAGVELDASAVEAFGRALAQHAGAALTPDDMIPRERVDAVVPGGLLGLELADELECLRPFGMGNPQPTLLVPAARFQHVAGMGEERRHSRFTLVTAGGARSRGVAFGTAPGTLAPAQAENHDIALRLERNRWNGMVEPRVLLRALCPTLSGVLRVLGEEGTFWQRLGRALERGGAFGLASGGGELDLAGDPVDRRCEGFAGVAGDLFTSGERVLVVVADVARRRVGLEQIVAGLAPDAMPVASWQAIGADPSLARAFDHLVALDPPPRGTGDPLLRIGPRAHIAWGPPEAEFALLVYRAQLDLRPALTEAYRALRTLGSRPTADELEAALRGRSADHPRTPELCARLVGVLEELGLIEFAVEPPASRLIDATRRDLAESALFVTCKESLGAIERALSVEGERRTAARAA
jgi:single-stranded-DNA-specific exonuclease